MTNFGSVLSAHWLPSLLSLDLTNNPLGPRGVEALARGLCAPLRSLNLACTGAKEKGVEALAEVLREKKVSSLQSLDLIENQMKAEGLKHLAAVVSTADAVPELRTLIPKKNNLADGATVIEYAPLSTLLSTNRLTELEVLDLSKNFFLAGSNDGVSAAAFTTASRFPKLRVLNLADTWISPAQMNALGEGGWVGCVLEDLDLSGWRIDLNAEGLEVGVQSLANALISGSLSHFECLKLVRRNDVCPDGLEALCRGIVSGKVMRLRTFKIQSSEHPNNLEGEAPDFVFDESVRALAEAAREGRIPSIRNLELDLSSGFVSPPRMSELGRALGSVGASSLQKLDLKWMCSTEGAVVGLAEGLEGEQMSSLEDLSLNAACEDPEGARALGEVLSTGRAPSLRRVDLVWPASKTLSSLCEGLSVGTSPPPLMRMDLTLGAPAPGLVDYSSAMSHLSEAIRADHISFLRKIAAFGLGDNPQTLKSFGEALTHANARLIHLEEVDFRMQSLSAEAFLRGVGRGGSYPPALHTLSVLSGAIHTHGPALSPLSILISEGKVPALREVKDNLAQSELGEVQAM
uniref:Uncharacterized protein n=1 Tax=Chromera velia CCMP2878 TaxID=1169474 RepID=A0A0G4HEG5_9ALVE|eukprot:Cvel_26757.t1-p1 / transcript=Cvel_26757.t1 / gene=Cvel_26757 / organism=Chromera_velia_CCMP2878 / gene_product=Leucine-rich repeat-containing protein LOC400891, putative / transcript_product=Leucine-rich repeat-containing protein LOC400891, putative / location=Cvel_scaffold3233:4784-6505(-) / protein_length=574 / sequence_SO=supercontig / SO=protein_coding / is_pseudo=false